MSDALSVAMTTGSRSRKLLPLREGTAGDRSLLRHPGRGDGAAAACSSASPARSCRILGVRHHLRGLFGTVTRSRRQSPPPPLSEALSILREFDGWRSALFLSALICPRRLTRHHRRHRHRCTRLPPRSGAPGWSAAALGACPFVPAPSSPTWATPRGRIWSRHFRHRRFFIIGQAPDPSAQRAQALPSLAAPRRAWHGSIRAEPSPILRQAQEARATLPPTDAADCPSPSCCAPAARCATNSGLMAAGGGRSPYPGRQCLGRASSHDSLAWTQQALQMRLSSGGKISHET
jgi:hypothetical protein